MFTADGGEWVGQNVFKANNSMSPGCEKSCAAAFAQLCASVSALLEMPQSADFRATEQWFVSIDHNDCGKS